MNELVAFLRARLEDDEERAFAARAQWDDEDARQEWNDLPEASFAHARNLDPARVLREVEAKRRILDRYEDAVVRREDPDHSQLAAQVQIQEYADWVIPLLAVPYADHPDYRQEWRP